MILQHICETNRNHIMKQALFNLEDRPCMRVDVLLSQKLLGARGVPLFQLGSSRTEVIKKFQPSSDLWIKLRYNKIWCLPSWPGATT